MELVGLKLKDIDWVCYSCQPPDAGDEESEAGIGGTNDEIMEPIDRSKTRTPKPVNAILKVPGSREDRTWLARSDTVFP